VGERVKAPFFQHMIMIIWSLFNSRHAQLCTLYALHPWMCA